MRVLSKSHIGFQPGNEVFYRAYNFILAAALLLLVLPLLIILSALLFATQGREIFYCAERLGKDQKVFRIIKFRTLCNNRARELTQTCTLPFGSNIETPLGGLLRETRLDELPQLLNILNGDMNLCGPRPVRAEIAAIERNRIPHYDLRFRVKPGLVGPTQAYFGHGASKRLRARMNNSLVGRPVSIRAELLLLGRIAFAMLAKTLSKVQRKAGRLVPMPARNDTQAPRREMWLTSETGQLLSMVDSIGLHEIVAPNLSVSTLGETVVLNIRLRSGGVRKARMVLSGSSGSGRIGYAPKTEFGQFVIERYGLGLVVVAPKIGEVVRPPKVSRTQDEPKGISPFETPVEG